MHFAIDDSEIEIEGRPHTILAALGVRDPSSIEAALNTLKSQFGLAATDEVKWNGMRPLPQRDREALSEELMNLLHKSIPLITISEGRDKQLAAERIAIQVADFIRGNPNSKADEEPLQLVFDEGILDDEQAYFSYLQTLSPSPMSSASVVSVRSHENSAVQVADVLAGFNKLATEIALGRANKEIIVEDTGPGHLMKIDLLNYISQSLRWAIWGSVPAPPDPQNVSFTSEWPFKSVGGYGLRISSTISSQTVQRIYDSRRVYMGCLH